MINEALLNQAMPLVEQLAEIIKSKKRHKYYDRVVELADNYRRMMTNEDTDKFYRQVIKREQNEWFEQRKRLTNLVLMPLTHTILQPESKVSRSNDLHREIKFTNDSDGTQAKELTDILGHFQGDKSLEYYMRNRLHTLSNIDPNSWIVIEFPEVPAATDKRVQPYPYEVSAREAIMYEYSNYILQYLVAMTEVTKDMVNYTYYGQNQTIKFAQLNTKKYGAYLNTSPGLHQYGDMTYYTIGRAFYEVVIPIPHDIGHVPAYPAGYHMDPFTNETTYVNTFHTGVPYLMDTVKAKSERDLTMALHAFPIRIQYEPPCPSCGGRGVDENGAKCTTCKGTGTLISTTTQEVITFPLPHNAAQADLINLDGLIAFSRPPTDIIQVMIDNLDKIKQDAYEAVWGKNTFIESAGNVTAEQILSQENNKYDNLYKLAEHMCNFWTFAAKTIANIVDMDNGLTIWMSVGKEFSVKSKGELSLEYQSQKNAGMSSEITRNTEREIVKIDYSNEPDKLRRYDVRTMFRPFGDKTDAQIQTILVDKSETTIEDRVLWINYDRIWDDIELNNEGLYEKPVKEIKRLLDAAVKKLIVKIGSQQAVTGMISFDEANAEPGAEGGVEGEAASTNVEAEAKAKLKGTVGGIQGLIEINKAVFEGIMSETAAELLIMEIYGFNAETAAKLIQMPEQKTIEKITEIKEEIEQ